MEIILKILLVVIVLALIGGFFVWREMGLSPSKKELAEYEKLSYFANEEFKSPQKMIYEFDKVRNKKAGFVIFLGKSSYAPQKELLKVELQKKSFPSQPEDFAAYWLGHSSLIMEIGGKRAIFDPVLDNAAPVPFVVPRYGKAPISRSELPEVDYVVITHNHYDHLERKTVQSIKSGKFIVPLGVATILKGWGIASERIVELGWGDVFEQDGLKIVAEEGVHFSARGKFDRNQTLWNSYVIQSGGKQIFWGGDTGYGAHFERIGKKYGSFDLVALEIDGWNTGWPNTHLFPKEVVQAAKDLRAKNVLPIHWAVFDLALHPWDESIEMILNEAKKANFKIMTPKIGERFDFETSTTQWWKE